MGALEIFQKKKGNKVQITFSVTVDEDLAPSAVSTIRRKLTAIDMSKNSSPNSDIPIVRTSTYPVAG